MNGDELDGMSSEITATKKGGDKIYRKKSIVKSKLSSMLLPKCTNLMF